MASAAGRPRGDGPAELVLMHDLLLRLPAGVAYVAGTDLAFEFANDEFRKIAGGRDLIGVPLRETLPERGREHLDLIENVARTGEACRGRESEVWIGGHGQEPEQLFVDFSYQPVLDEAGGVSGVLLYGADVTAHVRDRRRLEELAERLAVSEERYRTLFETLPYGVIHYNADGSILGANPAAADILGLAPDGITSWPLVESRSVVHEDLTPFEPDKVPVTVALRTGEIVADVVAGLPDRRTGEIRWLQITAVPDARDAQGQPQRAYAMLSDITEQRRAEAALRESHRLLERLREANVLGVVVVSDDGILEANDAYLDIIGYTRDDLESGRFSWRAITPPRWTSSDEDAVRQLRRAGACRPFEKEYVRRDGQLVPVLIGSAVIDRHPLRWISIVIDLTARQREEQERAAQVRALNVDLEDRVNQRTAELIRAEADRRALETELRRAERLVTVGQLTSGIAHDFGNLLAVIVGYAEMAEDVSQDPDPELRRILDEIRVAADRAVHLSSDLLSFSRRGRTRPEAIELNAVVSGIRDLLTVSLSGCAEVNFQPWPDVLPAVQADRGQLEQVLLNLALNARDAMPGGGKLTITTGPGDFDGQRTRPFPGPGPQRYAQLAVTDTGTGMSKQVRARIFERFFTTKPPGTGTGLGLSTVHGIISDAGGMINVESEEGRGTTFRIYLPVAQSA